MPRRQRPGVTFSDLGTYVKQQPFNLGHLTYDEPAQLMQRAAFCCFLRIVVLADPVF